MESNYKPPSLDSALDKIKKETVGNTIFDKKFLEEIICWHIICKIKKMLVIILVDEMRGQRRYRSAWASLAAQMVKNLPAMKHRFDLWVRKIPWRRKWQPTPVFENPMESKAWRATVHWVAKSRTWLNWLTLSLSEQRAGWRRVESVPGRAKGSYPAHSTKKIL